MNNVFNYLRNLVKNYDKEISTLNEKRNNTLNTLSYARKVNGIISNIAFNKDLLIESIDINSENIYFFFDGINTIEQYHNILDEIKKSIKDAHLSSCNSIAICVPIRNTDE